MTRRVVIGYDGSTASDDAVEFGLAWCRATRDVPVAATVYPEEHPLGIGRVDVEWAVHVRRLGQETLDRARALAGDAAQYRLLPSTSAARGLEDLASDIEAAAIVLGRAHGDAGGGTHLGGTTDRLLHGATVPVCVVPEGWEPNAEGRIRRIGVAFVDTRDGHAALGTAVRAATLAEAQLTLLTVMSQQSEHFSYIAGRRDEQEFYDASRAAYRTALDFGASGVPAELSPRTVLLEGDVVDQLVDVSPGQVDVLVCGSRGYGPVRRVLLGGVSRRLVQRAKVPVTVVPRAATRN